MGHGMTDFPFAIVGFDLDGTLLDTSADLANAVNYALDLGKRPPLSVDAIKPMIGGGAKLMLEKGLQVSGGYGPELMAELYPALLGFYEANISAGTVPFAGMIETLDRLDAMDVKVAIVTNKFERFAVKLIGELGLTARFATIIGGDTMGPGKAKPNAAPILEMIRRCGGGRAAFVGDSIYDILAAKNAQVPNVAVSFGFLMQPIEELEADAVIDHYDELIPTLERLGRA